MVVQCIYIHHNMAIKLLHLPEGKIQILMYILELMKDFLKSFLLSEIKEHKSLKMYQIKIS